VLEGAQATRAEVLKHAAAREYLHFACHGQYHWSNVELSGLFLADGLLTLDELAGAELDLTALRLVTLSACETGVAQIFRRVSGNVFTTAADEYIGLSTGLLRTGAPAVLCSLWPVDDYATSLLMGAFYQRHLGEALSIGRALREAQRWVRGLRLDELRQRLAAELESLERRRAAGAADAADERQAEELRIWLEELEVAPAGEPPLSHPYYWAGFNAVGAVLEGPPRRRPV
jgi:CHAT domain-containing protein